MSKKQKRQSGDLVVSVVMTVQADPDQANVGTYDVEFDVEGPEVAVGIVRMAYRAGLLSRGIDAFVDSVARSIAPRPSVSGRVGLA